MFKNLRSIALSTVFWSLLTPTVSAQVNLGTNVLYDLAMLPSLSVEVGLADRLSLVGSATYGSMEGWPYRQGVRMGTADVELRRWTKNSIPMRRGYHVGAYVAAYHYDVKSGSTGWQARFNWGVGFNWGCMAPISNRLGLGFTLGIGYVGGNYKKYEESKDLYHHNVWEGDYNRTYFGPTKVELSLIWHIGSAGKGGAR